LIRSKGVGVYFITQNPLDIPEKVLGQLGNRVQHALRAFTPGDQKAVQSAAQTFRQNPKLNVAEAITQLSVGEALISLLEDSGAPGVVQRAWIVPPHSQIGPITADERKAIIAGSVIYGTYETAVNRESAAEILRARTQQRLDSSAATPPPVVAAPAPASAPAPSAPTGPTAMGQAGDFVKDLLFGHTGPRGGQYQGLAQKMITSTVRTMGSTAGREIMRGLLGSIFGSSRR
jgi:hypothetical protein